MHVLSSVFEAYMQSRIAGGCLFRRHLTRAICCILVGAQGYAGGVLWRLGYSHTKIFVGAAILARRTRDLIRNVSS
jgi:hypothetical protein